MNPVIAVGWSSVKPVNSIRTAARPGSRRLLLLLFLIASNGEQSGEAFPAFNSPEAFISAVALCSYRGASLGNAELVLAADVQDIWSGLSGTEPSSQGERGAAPSLGGLWTWDESRLCLAALLTQQPTAAAAAAAAVGDAAPPAPVLVSLEGRPCTQRLSYVCVPDADVRAAGLTPSSEWFRAYVRNGSTAGAAAGATAANAALVVGSSSPHLLGPERSGLVLLRSGFALGGTRVPLGLKAEEWGPRLMNNTLQGAFGMEPYFSIEAPAQLQTLAFDDSERFWSRGPVVSAFTRSYNGRLLALRPVREAEVDAAIFTDTAAAAAGNTSSASNSLLRDGVFGASRPDLDGISSAPYETHHVGSYNDYVVTVQGCFRTLAVEVLLLATRSGRRYRLGRGSCTVWFREDAPPGGYLAGFAGLHLDVGYWSSQPPMRWAEGQVPNAPWLMQLELVWAAPAGSQPPTYTQRLPALLRHSTAQIAPPSSACPGAYPLASLDHQQMHYCTWPWRELATPYAYEPITGVGCPSNMCCGTPVYASGVYIPYNYFLPICSADVTGCMRRCQVQAGLCGVVPDRPVLHFAVSSSAAAGSNATTAGVAAAAAPVSAPVPPQQSYIVYPDTHVSYEAAAEMCRSSTYMGLAWRLVAAREVLTWTTALDLRNPAYGVLVELGYFWLGGVSGATASNGGSACATALYGSAGVGDSDGSATPDYDRITYDSSVPCDGVGAVVCALAAAPADPEGGGGNSSSSSSSSSSVLVPPGRGGGQVWSPGPHRLTASRRIASGNYGNISCSATLLETANSSTSSQQQQQQQQPAALTANSTVVLAAPPRAFLVSTAVQVSEVGNSVSAVSALGVELGGGGSAAIDANMTAGNPSTRGWHRLELQPGEGVVAASGCAGGHLEVLLLHTSSGRVLMSPLTAGPEDAATGSAACSSSFVEMAPAGAYLVGLQVTFGQFIESLRLLWGQPLAALGGGSSSNGGSGNSGSNVGSPEGSEGRGGGVLDSSVAVGGGLGAAAPSSVGTHGEQQPAALGGVGNISSSGSSSTPQSGSSGGGGGPVSAAAIGGAVVGGVALALAVAAAVVLRRRYARRQAKQSPEGKLHSDGSVGPAATGPPKGSGGGGGYSDPAGATSPLSSCGCAMASGSASSIANNSASDSTLNAHVSNDITLAAVPSAADTIETAQAVFSVRQPVSGVCGDRRAAYVTLLVEGGEGGSGAAAARGRVSGVLAAARSCVSPGRYRPAPPHVAGAASEAGTGTAVRQAALMACPVGPGCGSDAAAATQVTRILSLGASENHIPQPQEQPSSQRQQVHHAGTAPRNAGVPGRDVRCHSGSGSVAASPSACRPPESPLPRLWATLSWAVSPTIQLTGTTESEGLPSSKRWAQMPMSGRWEQLSRISSLERLPSASQSLCCAVPVEATPGEGDAAPAPLPAPQGLQELPAMAEELDFHRRMCAYVSSCHVLASGALKFSSVVDDAGAPVGAAQQQEAEGGGALGAQPAQEPPVTAGAALGDDGNGGPQGIEQSLVHAQAQLAGREQEQQGAQRGQRRDLVLTSVLGSGSFGVVFNGTWRGLRVAVKTLVVHDSLLGTEARRRHRAVLEAAISKSLNHPNVVTTYETEVIPLSVPGTARNLSAHPDPSAAGGDPAGIASEAAVLDATTDTYKLLLVMEYCDAGSLTRALEMGAVGSVAAGGAAGLCALTLALDVACGMRHIHARNIVHGDLSAGNILLCSTADAQCRGGRDLADAPLRSPLAGLWAPPLVAKVADFGLSVHMGEHQTHASNKFQGTPAYTAPEVLSRGRLSAAADVWSFGCILLELTHGERISRIRTRAATAAAAAPAAAAPATSAAGPSDLHGAGGKPVLVPWTAAPPGSSPRLAQLLAACLAMEPSARPSFDQVAEALVAILVESHRNAQHNVLTTMRVSSTPQPQSRVSESAGQ